jgi:hypothetical protein
MALKKIGPVRGIGTLAITAIPLFLRALNIPAGRMAEYAQNRLAPNQIPDIFTLIDMYNKNIISDDDYFDNAQRLGYKRFWAHELIATSKQLLTAGDYIHSWRRGIIDENTLDMKLQNLKIYEHDREILKEVSLFFPTPADLVQFAVREVYTPDIVEKFGQKEDLPDKFIEEAYKVGMSKEQAENYWAAHWDLPSILQGFEMLHRRVINQAELNQLLRAKDVMPFWRDKLTKISYNPLTRVDVRRMYSVGVLDREGVYNSYLDIGYNAKNAELMTEFTIRYENDAMEGLTRATVVSAYKDAIITREELKTYLEGFGYTDDVVVFWLENADYERTLEEVKLYKDDLISLYKKGAISVDDIRNFLLSEDLPATYIDRVVAEAITLKAERTKVPSKEDLSNWLTKGYIDETYYVEKMRLIGYTDNDIQIYLTIIAEGQDTSARKFLKLDIYLRWYANGILSREQLTKTLVAMQMSLEDIQNIIGEMEASINEITQ